MSFLKPVKIASSESKFQKSKRNGLRKSIFSPSWPLKSCYKGEWKNDRKEGKGSQISGTKWLYEGDWYHGYRHGYGVLSKVLKTNEIWKCYAGNWVKGKKQGFGSLWYIDGGYYEGNFWQNHRHGFGRIWYGTGDFYQGTWVNDLHQGDGMFVQGNGNRYEGQFYCGKKHGRGIYYHLDSGQLQEGCWHDDICVLSTMEDFNWRQTSRYSTFFSIPQNNLSDRDEVISRREKEVIGVKMKNSYIIKDNIISNNSACR